MSDFITTAFVEQYRQNAIQKVQQKGSRLRPFVREEGITGNVNYFELIGATTARLRPGRHTDTPRIDTKHFKRAAFIADYDWADLVDNEDKARLLIDPASEYMIAGTNAMKRAQDDVIISAATAASAQEGTPGSLSAVSFPDAQKVAVGYVPTGSASPSNLTLNKLIKAKSIFGVNDVDDDIPLYFVLSQLQLDALLRNTTVTSVDYNSVKALVKGEIDSFMGFNFIRTQRLPIDSDNIRTCFAFAGGMEGGLGLNIGNDLMARVTERSDKNYAVQPFLSMSLGAVRVEDEKVVWISCDEDL